MPTQAKLNGAIEATQLVVKSNTDNLQPGQDTMANSVPVVIASNQSTLPISAATLPLPTGAATAALQTQPGVDIGDVTVNNGAGAAAVNIQDGGNSITIDGAVTANAGTNLNTSALALETTQLAGNVLTGSVTEAAPATDTASSGLNGRLQRIAQRLTSIFTALSDKTQFTKITDGTNDATVKAASTAAVAADKALVVAISPNNTVPITAIPVSNLQTYSAAVSSLVIPAAATDIFTITGSATKTIKIFRIEVTASKTAAATGVNLLIIKRSTDNTLGTFSNPTKVPLDSNNGAATATIRAYTANPTLGTIVGNLLALKLFVNTSGNGTSDTLFWDSDILSIQPIVLRGITEMVAVNLGGGTVSNPSFDVTILWTEE